MAESIEKVKNKEEIFRAAFHGNIEKVKHLLIGVENINEPNSKGKTILMMALIGDAKKKEKHQLVNYLLVKGADPNVISAEGDPTLHVAVRSTTFRHISRKLLQCLLDFGANNSMKNKDGDTASKVAYKIGNVKLGDFLLFYDPEPVKEYSKPSLGSELLSCLFPAYGYLTQFNDEMEVAIQKDRMDKLLDRDRPNVEGSSTVASSEKIFYLEDDDDTLIDVTHDSENNTNDENSTEVKNIEEPDNVEHKEESTEKDTPKDIRDHELITIVQICNDKKSSGYSVCDELTKHATIYQLPQNEYKSIRKNDDKIHQLSRINNEDKFNDAIRRSMSFVYT